MRRMAVMVAAAAMASACATGSGGPAPGARLEAVASFYPLAVAAERVGGDAVVVENLTPAGAEPHDLELAPRQVDTLLDADVVVLMGEAFQPAIEEVAARRSGPTVEVLTVLGVSGDEAQGEHAGEDEHAGEEEQDGHGHETPTDPHVWLDPTLMAQIVEQLAAVLGQVAPDEASSFDANARAFVEELRALDARYEETLSDCERDTIVVQHEAFGWLAARYGLQQEGIAGLSPEAEPSPQRLAELSELVEQRGITTVFTERRVSARVAETLAREAGVDVAVLDPLEGLTEEQQAQGADYLSVMEENLRALGTALRCG
jgi:zinc transport system substrate-binding protein